MSTDDRHIGRFLPKRGDAYDTSKESIATALAERQKAFQAEFDAINDPLRRFASIVGAAYAKCRLSTFVVDASWTADETRRATAVREAISVALSRIDEFHAKHRQIVFYGPPGVGKDHLMSAMMWQSFRTGRSVRWLNGTKFHGIVRDQSNYSTMRPIGEWTQDFVRPDVLALSDPDIGGVSPMFYHVIDARARVSRPTWITLNATNEQDIAARLGMANWDRLRKDAWIIHCDWPSARRPVRFV